ncbi:hypothetical protein MRB53_024929 [Persea americana]|uniref:Uncharacterized protein n=1 Tax=Persea americana TaxID=3435 RepID=A0ACC2LDV9_PERAE|nr:hypothetical protein MRB53_024929 [Persea americana]
MDTDDRNDERERYPRNRETASLKVQTHDGSGDDPPSPATRRGNSGEEFSALFPWKTEIVSSVLLLWILRQQTISLFSGNDFLQWDFAGIGRCKSGSLVSSASNFGLLLQETSPWPSRGQNPDLVSLLRISLQIRVAQFL